MEETLSRSIDLLSKGNYIEALMTYCSHVGVLVLTIFLFPGIVMLIIMALMMQAGISSLSWVIVLGSFISLYLWGALWWRVFGNITFIQALNAMRGAIFAVILFTAYNVAGLFIIGFIGWHLGFYDHGTISSYIGSIPPELIKMLKTNPSEAGEKIYQLLSYKNEGMYVMMAVTFGAINHWGLALKILNFESEVSVYETAIENSKNRE